MNEDFSGSVTSSEYAIAIDPNDADSLLNKANALYRLGISKKLSAITTDLESWFNPTSSVCCTRVPPG